MQWVFVLIIAMCWPANDPRYVESIGIGESRRSEGEARAWARDAATWGMDGVCHDRGFRRVISSGFTDPACSQNLKTKIWRCDTRGQGWCSNEDP
jgi:hypothetical protein